MSDSYLPGKANHSLYTIKFSDVLYIGAVVLAHSLRDNGTKKQLAALVTLDTLQTSTLNELKVGHGKGG